MRNPFKPTAGKNPPNLIGRDAVIDEFLEGIENGPGAPGRLMRISGMRGVGKTVMLNEIGSRARAVGWDVIDETASEGFCERMASRLATGPRATEFTANPSLFGVSLGSVKVEQAALTLRDLLAKHDRGGDSGLLITLDEVQDASIDEIRALSVAVQHEIREDANIAFVFAGLPSMMEDVVNGKTLTFLRRAVPVELEPVGVLPTALSMGSTMRETGIDVAGDVMELLAQATRGYPFMIQLVGYHAWQLASRVGGVLDEGLASQAIVLARDRFDATVIEPALQRVAPGPMAYLLAMAEDEGAPSSTRAVAGRLGKDIQQASPIRARLIREDVIEATGWGKVSFAIPYLADYLVAHRDELLAEMG